MKRFIVHIFIGMASIAYLPGCGRIVDWGKDQFYQGEDVTYNVAKVRDAIRSIKIYDQMSTVGMFDALWLSDEVRTEYAYVHAHKEGRDPDRTATFLRRQLEENRHYISFYVVVPQYIEIGLTTDDDWSVFLQIDNAILHPAEVRPVDLTPEFQLFFCKRFNRFKTAYSVKFDAKNKDESYNLTPETRSLMLCFRSVNKQAALTWNVDHGVLLKENRPRYNRECEQ